MPALTDPFPAFVSFQEVFGARQLEIQRGRLDSRLRVHYDKPNGAPRFTYVLLDGRTVTSMVEMVVCDPVEGLPCFNVGYAVAPAYRGRGLAKQLLVAAIAEMRTGFTGNPPFYVEAIVSVNNIASQHVAAHGITTEIVECTDDATGEACYQYLKQFTTCAKR